MNEARDAFMLGVCVGGFLCGFVVHLVERVERRIAERDRDRWKAIAAHAAQDVHD